MSDLKEFQIIKRRSFRFVKQSAYYKAVYQIRILDVSANIEIQIWFNGDKWSKTPHVDFRRTEDGEMPEYKESEADRDIELQN